MKQQHSIIVIDSTKLDTPFLKGKSLCVAAFRNWIKEAEAVPTISLTEAKEKWSKQRNQLGIVHHSRKPSKLSTLRNIR